MPQRWSHWTAPPARQSQQRRPSATQRTVATARARGLRHQTWGPLDGGWCNEGSELYEERSLSNTHHSHKRKHCSREQKSAQPFKRIKILATSASTRHNDNSSSALMHTNSIHPLHITTQLVTKTHNDNVTSEGKECKVSSSINRASYAPTSILLTGGAGFM